METLFIAGFIVAAVCAVSAALYNLIKLSSLSPEERYQVIRFRGEMMTIGFGLWSDTCPVKDIEEVRFSKIEKRGRISFGDWKGEMQIVKKSGKYGRRVPFDGSVYYKHMVWITSEHGIDLATELLMKELEEHGVRCVRERYGINDGKA